MLRTVRRLLVSLLVLASAAVSCHAAPAPIGKAVRAESTVSGSGPGGSRTVVASGPVYFLDRISANATGVGQFELDDGTRLVVGNSASLTIDKFVYKGGASFQRLGINFTKGAFRFISGKSSSSSYQIVTPVGTMGIRGTAFDVTIRNGKAYVALIEGNVRFCSGKTCKTLRRSCDYIIAGGGKITDPQAVSNGLSGGAITPALFPLMARQSLLHSKFRLPKGNCLTRTVHRPQLNRVQQASLPSVQAIAPPPGSPTPPGPPGPPSAAGKPNNPGNSKQVGNAGNKFGADPGSRGNSGKNGKGGT